MTKYTILLSVLLLSVLTACEEVISIDYKTSSSQVVIEGNVYDETGPYTINISKSVAIDDPSTYPPVTGATVTISDNAGNAETLAETSSGIYQTSTLQGTPGRTYTLTVTADGQTYIANSTMPAAVEIDSLYSSKMGDTEIHQVNIDLTDPADIQNYYRLVDVVNGKSLGNDLIANDELSQGKEIKGTLFYNEEDLKAGDILTIWLETIDKGVYTYFNTASLSNQNSATPANPKSNISNKALGYFNACSVRKKSIVIP
jgi:hypothetical protein